MNIKTENFSEWRNYILASIKTNSENIDKLEIAFIDIRVDIGRLKLLSAILGGIAGVIGTVIIMILCQLIIG